MEIEVGSPGQFDVFLGDEVVASKGQAGFLAKLLGGGFPDESAVVEILRQRLPGSAGRAG